MPSKYSRTRSTLPAWRAQSIAGTGVRALVSEVFMASFAEEFGAGPEALGDVALDGLGGEAELAGDVRLGAAFEFMEEEDGTGGGPERSQGLGQEQRLFLVAEAVRNRGSII